MTTLQLTGIGVTHDGVVVLDGLDLTVPSGEVTALLGPSGSGKTTLLRVITGLDDPTTGNVLLDGQDVTHVRSSDRDLSYVAQGAPMLPDRDLAANLSFPLRIRGVGRTDATRTAEEHGRRFGLGWVRGRQPSQLSSGEQAAAGIARGTIRPPRVLLLDEPVPHLDPAARAHVLRRIGDFQHQQGVTVLLATNDVRVAEVLADRVAVIDRHRIVRSGRLTDVRDDPGTVLCADLVAPAPLRWLPAVVRPGPRSREIAIDTGAGRVISDDPALRRRTGPVLLGIGPRDAVLAGPGTGSMTGRLRRVATTGHRRLVTVTTSAGDIVVDTSDDLSWLPATGGAVDVDVRRAHVADGAGDVLVVIP